jgi:hypothetical protein
VLSLCTRLSVGSIVSNFQPTLNRRLTLPIARRSAGRMVRAAVLGEERQLPSGWYQMVALCGRADARTSSRRASRMSVVRTIAVPPSASRDSGFCKRRLALLRMLKILMGLLLGLPIWPEVDATALGPESIVCHDSEVGFEDERTQQAPPSEVDDHCPLRECWPSWRCRGGGCHRILPCAPRSSSASHASCIIALALVSLLPFCLPRH